MQGQSYFNQAWGKAFSVYRSAPNLYIASIWNIWGRMEEPEKKPFKTFALAKAYIKGKEKEAKNNRH